MSFGKGELKQVVTGFLQEEDLRYEELVNKPDFLLGLKMKNGSWQVRIRVDEDQERVMVLSTPVLTSPLEKRLPMAALLTRANYGLFLGNFEMDLEDGEIRYKTSIDVEGGALTLPMMRNLFLANVCTTNRYLPAINQVLYNNVAPEEACNAVEHPLDDDDLDDLLRDD